MTQTIAQLLVSMMQSWAQCYHLVLRTLTNSTKLHRKKTLLMVAPPSGMCLELTTYPSMVVVTHYILLLVGSYHLDNRVFSRPVAWPVVTMDTLGQTNQRTMTAGAQALSGHYIMLIRPLQALPMVRIYRKLFIFKYIF